MPYLDRQGDVFVLYLGDSDRVDDEITIDAAWVDRIHHLLDMVEHCTGPAALVTTGVGEFYCLGVNPEDIAQQLVTESDLLELVHSVYRRLLGFPMPTLAAINGHAFGTGAGLTVAHDFRVMNTERGQFCLPEAHLSTPFSKGTSALAASRLPAQTAVEAITYGRRYGGREALAAQIVDKTAGDEELLTVTVEWAAALTDRRTPALPQTKKVLYHTALAALAAPDAPPDLPEPYSEPVVAPEPVPVPFSAEEDHDEDPVDEQAPHRKAGLRGWLKGHRHHRPT